MIWPSTKKMNLNKTHTVGIAGSLCRMGTTTQAIQIIKYLLLMGYKACYIEMSDHEYINNVKNLYHDVKENGRTGKTSYMDVEMYSKAYLPKALKQDYDFCIKDYGNIGDKNFEKTSFLEQEIKILVCGIKPNEIFQFQEILEEGQYEDANFIFSFVPKEDRDAIMALMEEKKNQTYFADYTPDAFLYTSTLNHAYKSILKI